MFNRVQLKGSFRDWKEKTPAEASNLTPAVYITSAMLCQDRGIGHKILNCFNFQNHLIALIN